MRNRIPWWPELISKRKGHDVRSKSKCTTKTHEINEACKLKNVEDSSLVMRNDNTTCSDSDEEYHDSETIIENIEEALD